MTAPRLVAASTLVLSLAGCGGSSPARPAPTTTPITPATTVRSDFIVAAYLATKDVPRCRSMDELLVSGDVSLAAVPANELPPGGIGDLHQLAGRWTTRAIPARQIVTTADVAEPPIAGC